jgi:lipocalin
MQEQMKDCKMLQVSMHKETEGLLYMGQWIFILNIPYFPVDNARGIYTKMFSKREKTTVRVIHKVRVMQLKSKKFQNT